MLLYNSTVSGNCYKVRLLAHLEMDYETREVDVVERSGREQLLGELKVGIDLFAGNQRWCCG
jgi:glutathione S-transferase